MADRYFILMNYENFGSGRPTQLNLGSMSYETQETLLKLLFKLKSAKEDNFGCGFDLFYDDTNALEVRPNRKTPVIYWNPKPLVNLSRPNELIIMMRPGLFQNTGCGVKRVHNCPLCVYNGKCKSPFIRKYIGSILFPDKYKKQK